MTLCIVDAQMRRAPLNEIQMPRSRRTVCLLTLAPTDRVLLDSRGFRLRTSLSTTSHCRASEERFHQKPSMKSTESKVPRLVRIEFIDISQGFGSVETLKISSSQKQLPLSPPTPMYPTCDGRSFVRSFSSHPTRHPVKHQSVAGTPDPTPSPHCVSPLAVPSGTDRSLAHLIYKCAFDVTSSSVPHQLTRPPARPSARQLAAS